MNFNPLKWFKSTGSDYSWAAPEQAIRSYNEAERTLAQMEANERLAHPSCQPCRASRVCVEPQIDLRPIYEAEKVGLYCEYEVFERIGRAVEKAVILAKMEKAPKSDFFGL